MPSPFRNLARPISDKSHHDLPMRTGRKENECINMSCRAWATGCQGSTVMGDLTITSLTFLSKFAISASSSPMLSSMAASVAWRA